jgi:hypothetical protein
MAINTTTLSGALTAYQTQFGLTSTTNVTAPVSTTGAGQTYLYCEAEMMAVTAVPVSGIVTVIRGVLGTKAVAHLTLTPVTIGLVADFPVFTPQVGAFQVEVQNRYQGIATPVAAAATIIAPANVFHVTGTTATNIITPPANFVGGTITIIADAAWTWTSSTVANGIFMTGAVTSAGETVTFTYDPNTTYWYPSRRA